MSYTSGTSGLSSYSSTPDGSKSIIRLEIPEPDPLSKPKSLCAGTECIALTLLVGIVIIVVCVIAQISVIAEANTVLSQMNPPGYLIVSPWAPQGTETPSYILQPCILPSLKHSGNRTHQCNLKGLYCPHNYTCATQVAPVCIANKFKCSDQGYCYDYIMGLELMSNSDLVRAIPFGYKIDMFTYAVSLLAASLGILLLDILIFIYFKNQMHRARWVFSCTFGLGFFTLAAITIPNLIFILAFNPHFRDMAWIEAADCFYNNSNGWFSGYISQLLVVSALLCVVLLTGEIVMIATISFFVPNIRVGFWNSNSFVVIAVFAAITFSVCCFLIFDRALGDG